MSVASKNIFWSESQDAWIEGKATWVDLKYVPTNNTSVEFEMAFLGPITLFRDSQYFHNIGSGDVLIGHMGTTDSNDWRMFSACGDDGDGIYSINRIYVDTGSGRAYTDPPADKRMHTNIWYHGTIGPGCKCHIDGILDASSSTSGTPSQSQTIKLFGENPASVSSNQPTAYAWLGFKYIKVYESGVLKMELRPGKRDGKACFIDSISGQAFFGLAADLKYRTDELQK